MKFGNFEFEPETDRLGEGPQSEVFRAVDARLGRTVALKILRPHVEFDPEAVTRFEREAKHTSALEHPNIATIYEYGQDRGTSYIVMEYLEGRALDRVLADRTLGYEEGLRVALQVGDALELVHKRGLIHRDLKPANIMLLADGTVKLLDFGICRSTGETNITQEGMLVGTVLYMSPEQVRGHELDVRSDVFAFGSVLYHALTGHLPFRGKSFPEVCMAILDGEPRRPSALRSGFPPALEEIILRCLARKPEDRYPDGTAVHAALISVEKDVSGGGRAATAHELRGRLFLAPLGAEPQNEHTASFAGGIRRDLAAELVRSTGLEVELVGSDDPATIEIEGYLLRGRLLLDGHNGTMEYSLRRVGPGSTEAQVTGVAEHVDADEWGLQGQIVRSVIRGVRKELTEQTLPSAAEGDSKRDPELGAALAHQAHEVLHRGTSKHLMSAISTFRRSIEADPSCALAHAGLAEALVRKYLYWDGDRSFLNEALETARRALVVDTTCAEAHTSLGFALAMSGDSDGALREYRLAIQRDNDEWLAHRFMGALLARQGNLKAASPLLRRAIALAPTHIGSYDHLYNVLQRLDRYEEGLEVADRGIEAARAHLRDVPDDQEARLHLSLLLARMGSHDEARAECERARARAPKDGYTLFHIACVLALLGSEDESMDALEEAQSRGYYVRSELWSNTDLDSLRELERFQKLAG
ncbi:protein kinase domain-containing protein [Engelhardtia mirabilis]|uniref:non-specific serine/threonine protein kinase n=1 Tax=Engelhardtia mirabilis TaxID=2528011 RepID=A0A518BH53_9BACT|nr:Serine/threonine-protein kinase StkP [Planctomycetes bacterium Pla133]QDV00610.1 Serine/threonine-protein kinase StkP [Planctomycetes bacterium Pla86]